MKPPGSGPAARHVRGPDDIRIEDTSGWLSLGHLRALIAKADELGWADSSLLSHGVGGDHPTRHDVRIAKRLVLEGWTPDEPEASS